MAQALGLLHRTHVLFSLGLMLMAGYWGGRAARALGLPRISGYVAVGMLLSPSISGLLSEKLVADDLGLVTDIALGIIAFSIGGALEAGNLRKLGRPILWITVFEALGTFLLVTVAAFLAFSWLWPAATGRDSLAMALLLGALSSATAPAAVLGVVHELRARGPVTTVVLGVVTLDDAVAIILFSLAGGVAGVLMGTGGSLLHQALVGPAAELLLALTLGSAAGLLFKAIAGGVRRTAALLCVSLGMIFLVAGAALSAGASSLLACMALGVTVVNLVPHPERWFEAVESIEEPIFVLFFVLAGAHLSLPSLTSAGALALVAIVARGAGKITGAWLGAKLSGAPETVRRYTPLGLLPQAGVAVGLVLAADELLPDRAADLLVAAVLVSVLVNELVAPFFVKTALERAGEASAERE